MAAILLLLTSAVAQNKNASVAEEHQPPDLHYELSVKDGRTLFHLGEAIEIEESYSADVPKKYLLLSLPQQVKGHPVQVTIEPSSGVIDRIQDDGTRNANSILQSNCLYGHGGGIGSGCGDCDARRPLSPSPVRIPLDLTRQFQITKPGRYSIQTKAANVVPAPLDMQSSVAIAINSNKLEIDVIEDPQWSKEFLWQTTDRFDQALALYISRGWNHIPASDMGKDGRGERTKLEWEMQQDAQTMALLDTEESLAVIIRRYDGSRIEWDYYRDAFYKGIIQSRHSSQAIDLLSERMLQPDFWVSEQVIDQFTAMKLQSQFPAAFDSNDSSHQKQLYPEARRILHDYVLAVGKSLAEKDSNAYAPSLNVFNLYAGQDYCTGKPLISGSELQEIDQQIGTTEAGSK
ncbi:MAG TPA: hypothetical protein VLA83_01640 [Candidatus Binatia bacterium]|nr:hypothetical protein [Candidatus Binatia bacterium]